MQKKRKSIFTAVVTVLFVLSVSYFAMLAPTTAWFYQEDAQDYNYSFTFRNFNESFAQTIGNVSVPLRAATRFADAGEWLFDEVAYVMHLETTNLTGSELTGIVHIRTDGFSNGINWFAFATDSALTDLNITKPVPGSVKGTYKSQIESTLSALGLQMQDYAALGETLYETGTGGLTSSYNFKAKFAMMASHQEGILVPTNSTKYIHIVFWAEYGDLKTALQTSSGGVGVLNTSALNTTGTITVTAEPYLGSYSTKTHTIRFENTSGSAITATVALAGESAQTVSVPANSHVDQTYNQDVQMRISVPSGSHLAKDDGTPGYVCGDSGTVCSISNLSRGFTLTLS